MPPMLSGSLEIMPGLCKRSVPLVVVDDGARCHAAIRSRIGFITRAKEGIGHKDRVEGRRSPLLKNGDDDGRLGRRGAKVYGDHGRAGCHESDGEQLAKLCHGCERGPLFGLPNDRRFSCRAAAAALSSLPAEAAALSAASAG